MGKALLEAKRPPMWRIEEGQNSAPKSLRFGTHHVLLHDIAGISLEEVRHWPVKGLLATAFAFVSAGSVMVYYVFDQGARLRFLFGAAFLTALGVSAFYETFKLRRISHYEMMLTLSGGRRLVFTSMDREDIQALALRIAAEQAQ